MEHRGQLTEVECWRLLSGAGIGRIAISVDALPLVVPVQIHVRESSLTACLGAFEVPRRALNGTVVGLEVDSLEPGGTAGWCVQMLARSSLPSAEQATSCPDLGELVDLEPLRISGQRVAVCPFAREP